MSRLGGWLRWIGCAAVWEAGRAVGGERHLEQTQGYALTATEDATTGSDEGIFIRTRLDCTRALSGVVVAQRKELETANSS